MLKKLFYLGLAIGGGWWWLDRQRRRMNPYDLRGKVAVITGASYGIGADIARAIASEGAHPVLVARSRDKLEALADELNQTYNAQAYVIAADLTRDDDLEHMANEIKRAFARVDVLINNAALVMGGPLTEYPPDDIRALIDLNLYGTIRTTQLLIPQMRGAESIILNMTSVAGGVIAPGHSVYATSKAGLHGFSESLRRELMGTGIHVIEFKPGWVGSAMTDRMSRSRMRDVGLVSPFTPFYESADMARHIVDAVRYRGREVIEGGIGFNFAILLQRTFPRLVDFGFTRVFDRDAIIDVMRDQGHG